MFLMDKENIRKRILVIGGTGFIGSNLVRYLIDRGNEVVVFHRRDSNLKILEGVFFKSAIGDLADMDKIEDFLYGAMQGCQIVYNLAACGSPLKKYQHLREIVNKRAAKIVAYVARKVGVQRLIHVSSSAAVGYPKNGTIADENFIFNAHYDHYALTKHEGEKIVLSEVEKGLNAVIAIPCSTLGLRGMKIEQLSAFKSIIEGKMWLYPAGGLCLTNIDDLTRGLYLCYEKGQTGKRYILGGHNITYKEYFEEIAHAAGTNAPTICLPRAIMPWLGFGIEVLFNFFKKEIGINKDVATSISRKLYYSSELAIGELGYTIGDWREAIKNIVSHFQNA